jgi:hypothetical protein
MSEWTSHFSRPALQVQLVAPNVKNVRHVRELHQITVKLAQHDIRPLTVGIELSARGFPAEHAPGLLVHTRTHSDWIHNASRRPRGQAHPAPPPHALHARLRTLRALLRHVHCTPARMSWESNGNSVSPRGASAEC